MTSRRRKGFTLIELIIVIVVISILAGISIATFTAVIRRANVSSVENSALSFNRELITLAAQKAASSGTQSGSNSDKSTRDGYIIQEALNSTAVTGAKDGPRGVTIMAHNGSGTFQPIVIWDGDSSEITGVGGGGSAATNIHAYPSYLQFVKNGASVCLRLSEDSTQAYDTTTGGTPMGTMVPTASISDGAFGNGWIIMRRVSAGSTGVTATANGTTWAGDTDNACNGMPSLEGTAGGSWGPGALMTYPANW
jgi:prepilin-type N-terminal cleavage/methylation domain-containing protein